MKKKIAIQKHPEKAGLSFMQNLSGSFFSKIFTVEDNYLQKFHEDDIVIHVSYYDSRFNLRVVSSLLKKKPVYISGYKRSIFSIVQRFLKKGLREYTEIFEKNYDLTHDGCFFSAVSESFFEKNYILSCEDPLEKVLELQRSSGRNVYLVPHLLLWNRDPEHPGANDSAGNKTFLSALASIYMSSTKPCFKVLEPLPASSYQSAAELRKDLHTVYENEKRIILGPVLKARHEIRSEILLDEDVVREIKKFSAGSRSEEARLRKKAYGYFNEIAADFSITYIKYFSWTLNKIYKKIYDAIEYDTEQLHEITRELRGAAPVFVAGHKSMMDFLLISSLFYNEGLTPPHVVAGVNMNFFPMGRIFRKSGGFFMRRSFRDDPLYALVFRRYIRFLVHNKYGLEFFIEGGRSRTGRLLEPKLGIMKYISEAMDVQDMKLKFVPISISYDRIFEEGTFVHEIRGREKSPESASEFVKTRRLLKKKFGKVLITFGKPLDYHDLMSEKKNDLHHVSEKIADEINNGMKVSMKNFVSAGVLAEEARGFYFAEFLERMKFIYEFTAEREIPCCAMLSKSSDFENNLLAVLRQFQHNALLTDTGQDHGDDIFFIKHNAIRQRLYYYRNSIVYHYIPLSIAASALLVSEKNGALQYKDFLKNYNTIKEIVSSEFYGAALYGETPEQALRFLENNNIILYHGMNITVLEDGRDMLCFAGRFLHDIFDSHFIVLNSLEKINGKKVSHSALMKEVRKNGVELFHLAVASCDESLSLLHYNNIIKKYTELKIISQVSQNTRLQIEDRERFLRYMESLATLLTGLDKNSKKYMLAQKKII